MVATIVAAIAALFLANKNIRQATWNFIQQGWVWLVGIIVGVLGTVKLIVDTIYGLITDLFGLLADILLPSPTVTQAVGDFLTVANTIFPVSEGFVIFAGLSVLWVTMLFYRFIKSWIPTLT